MVAFNLMGKLFSVTKAISSGAQLSNEGKTLIVKKGDVTFCYDKKLKRENVYLLACDLIPDFEQSHITHLSAKKHNL